MIFSSFTLYQYEIACSLLQKNRRGIIVHGKEKAGDDRWGELAPLEGFSSETLDESLLQLQTLLPTLIDASFTQETLLSLALYPSVFFALYSLLLPNTDVKAPLSGFVYLPNYEEEIPRLLSLGIQEAKIKIPPLPLQETIALLKQCLLLAQDQILFHLDINRRWSLAEWNLFCEIFSMGTFHYVEEPIASKNLTASLLLRARHPISLDESLREEPCLLHLNPYCIVMKPMLDPAFSHLRSFSGYPIAFSSSFETAIGTKALCHIHQKMNSRFALGVDTLRYLESSLFPYHIAKGYIHFAPFRKSAIKEMSFLCSY